MEEIFQTKTSILSQLRCDKADGFDFRSFACLRFCTESTLVRKDFAKATTFSLEQVEGRHIPFRGGCCWEHLTNSEKFKFLISPNRLGVSCQSTPFIATSAVIDDGISFESHQTILSLDNFVICPWFMPEFQAFGELFEFGSVAVQIARLDFYPEVEHLHGELVWNKTQFHKSPETLHLIAQVSWVSSSKAFVSRGISRWVQTTECTDDNMHNFILRHFFVIGYKTNENIKFITRNLLLTLNRNPNSQIV